MLVLRQREVFQSIALFYSILMLMVVSKTIFPRPSNQAPQRIHLTRRLLFGPTMFAGRPNDTISLKLDTLRVAATDALALMGLVPA